MKSLYFLVFLLASISVYAQTEYFHDSLEVDGGYIHYYTKGEGSPVVLLPGGPGFSHYYLRAIADSMNNYKTILIDFYGTGRSQYKEPDSTWVNQDHMVNDVELLRKHLDIEQWILLGQSWATHTALLYGIKYPKHTSKIILQATAGTDNSFQQYYGDNIRKGLTESDFSRLEAIRKDSTTGRLASFEVLLNGYFYDRAKSALFLNFPP